MKKPIIALACALALGMSAISAEATNLTVGDAYYLGNIVPGLPSGEGNEVSFIEELIALAPGGVKGPDPACGDQQTSEDNVCTRSNNAFANLPAPVFFDKVDDTNTVDVTGFSYVLGKYGNGSDDGQISHVWYVAGLTTATLPDQALSHISRFNATPTTVPDGGTTLMLLGSAMVGLAALRRRFSL